MTIEVRETETGFEISWDENDPLESMFNDFTEQDFIDIILDACQDCLDKQASISKRK